MKTLIILLLLLASCATIERLDNDMEVLYNTKALKVTRADGHWIYLKSFPETRHYKIKLYDHGYCQGDTLYLTDELYPKIRWDKK